MPKKIHLATILNSYDNIIKADRMFSSDELVLIAIESDFSKDSKFYNQIITDYNKIKDYAKLVNSKVHKIETVRVREQNTFYDIISKCVDIILKYHNRGDKLLLTITEGKFLLNGAFHYAGTIVKSFYNIDLTILISEYVGTEIITFEQEQLLTSSIWALISTKDKPLILDCIELGMNVEEMSIILDVSPGTISNWLHALESNKIITINKRERELTEIGFLISKITDRERISVLASKYRDIITILLKNGLSTKEIADRIGISTKMLEMWIETKDIDKRIESIHKHVKGELRNNVIQNLLKLKKELN